MNTRHRWRRCSRTWPGHGCEDVVVCAARQRRGGASLRTAASHYFAREHTRRLGTAPIGTAMVPPMGHTAMGPHKRIVRWFSPRVHRITSSSLLTCLKLRGPSLGRTRIASDRSRPRPQATARQAAGGSSSQTSARGFAKRESALNPSAYSSVLTPSHYLGLSRDCCRLQFRLPRRPRRVVRGLDRAFLYLSMYLISVFRPSTKFYRGVARRARVSPATAPQRSPLTEWTLQP